MAHEQSTRWEWVKERDGCEGVSEERERDGVRGWVKRGMV